MTFPGTLAERDWWVIWDYDEDGRKRPRAPWLNGHSYPAKWGADVDARPETDYSTAMMWTDLSTSALQKEAPAPRDDIDLKPGIILPHDNDNDILFLDLDDVRDPETGELTAEARAIVRRLGGWTEISASGTGLHIFVRGEMPNRTRVAPTDLDQAGHIEIYKKARFFGLTGDEHELSTDAVPEAQEAVDSILERYAPDPEEEDQERIKRIEENQREPDALEQIRDEVDDEEQSPYYDLDIRDVDALHHFERENNGTLAGPHPAHGGVHNDDADSTNTAVSGGVWYCHAHDSKGGALELVAVKEGIISCRQSDFGCLSDDELLSVCFEVADCVPDGAKPPYRALRALAEREDLDMRSEEDGVLGASAYQVALSLYRSEAYGDAACVSDAQEGERA